MNRVMIVLSVVSIVLGSLFLYFGFESGTSGYVTLSIDGAFLLLVGLVSLFAPRAEVADAETLASLSKQVEGASEYIPKILEGECSVRFTSDAKIALVWADGAKRVMIDPLDNKLRTKLGELLAADHGKTKPYNLASKYAKRLVELGALSEVKLEANASSVLIRLVKPVVGIPLLPEYGEPRRVGAIMLSSRLLATLASLVSADIRGETTATRIAKESEDLLIHMDVVGK